MTSTGFFSLFLSQLHVNLLQRHFTTHPELEQAEQQKKTNDLTPPLESEL